MAYSQCRVGLVLLDPSALAGCLDRNGVRRYQRRLARDMPQMQARMVVGHLESLMKQAKREKLKRCAHCGGDVVNVIKDADGLSMAMCDRCGMRTEWWKDLRDVVRIWNRRAR